MWWVPLETKNLHIVVAPLRVMKLHGCMAGFAALAGSQGGYGGKKDSPESLNPQAAMALLLEASQRVAWTTHVAAFIHRLGYHHAVPTEASHEFLSNIILPISMDWCKQPLALSLNKLCCSQLQSITCCVKMKRHYPVAAEQDPQGNPSFSPAIIVKGWHWPIGTYVLTPSSIPKLRGPWKAANSFKGLEYSSEQDAAYGIRLLAPDDKQLVLQLTWTYRAFHTIPLQLHEGELATNAYAWQAAGTRATTDGLLDIGLASPQATVQALKGALHFRNRNSINVVSCT